MPALVRDAATGDKTGFLRHLFIKMLILPRQARDKHRENSKKPVLSKTCSAVLVLGAAAVVTLNQAGYVGRALEAATAGLAMTYALSSVLALQATIIQSTELEIR
jgi:hypothetical protein